jgi:membrane protein required for colicin V production
VHWVDITILAIIAISVVISFFRGFLREALSLAVWIAAFWVAWLFFRDLAPFFAQWVTAPSLQLALAYTLIVIGAVIVGGIISWLIGLLIDKSGLSGTDRMIGLFFGAARGVIIVAIVVLLAGMTAFPQDPWWQESQLIPYFETIALRLKELLPEDIGQYLEFSTPLEPTSAAASEAGL